MTSKLQGQMQKARNLIAIKTAAEMLNIKRKKGLKCVTNMYFVGMLQTNLVHLII